MWGVGLERERLIIREARVVFDRGTKRKKGIYQSSRSASARGCCVCFAIIAVIVLEASLVTDDNLSCARRLNQA